MLRELLTEVMSLANAPVQDGDFIRHFNRAVDSLQNRYDAAKRIEKKVIVCTDTREEYDLAADNLGIQRVLNGQGYYFSDYTVRDNNKILFDRSGTFFVYEKLPHTHITNIDEDTPTINPNYLYPICKYIASKLCGDQGKATELMAEYELDTMQINLRKKPTKPRRAPLWR